MMEFADLHTHSNRSDGQDSVRELIDNAAATEGLRVIALCDHDVLPPSEIDADGKRVDPVEYAREKGLIFLPAIEISCDTFVDDVHIVGLFCDFTHDGMLKLERDMKRSKTDGYRALCDKLVERGIDVSWEYITDGRGKKADEIQRKHIFEAIAEKGFAPDWKTAKLMVRDDPSLNIKREKPDPVKAISLIHAAGGAAVLAHPYLIDESVTRGDGARLSRGEYIEMLLEAGLDGMEADYPYAKTSYKGSLGTDEIAGRVYREYGCRLKFLSGGSDYHAEHKKGVKSARALGDGRVPFNYFMKMIYPYA